MSKTQFFALRKAAPAPRPIITLTEVDLDAREQRILDAIADMISARPPKVLLDTSGLSQLLGVTGQTIKKLRDEGCPYVRVGECYRFDGDAVLEWLRQKSEGAK